MKLAPRRVLLFLSKYEREYLKILLNGTKQKEQRSVGKAIDSWDLSTLEGKVQGATLRCLRCKALRQLWVDVPHQAYDWFVPSLDIIKTDNNILLVTPMSTIQVLPGGLTIAIYHVSLQMDKKRCAHVT